MRTFLTAAATAALLLVGGGTALAAAAGPDTSTGGVSKADANAACAAVVGQKTPTSAQQAAFRHAYNTVDNTDDGPASVGISPEWQHLIVEQETHRDYLGMGGWKDAKDVPTFHCSISGKASFPAAEAPAPPTTDPVPPPTTTPAPTTDPVPPTTTPAPTTDPVPPTSDDPTPPTSDPTTTAPTTPTNPQTTTQPAPVAPPVAAPQVV